ncbi:MAG TPA: hypothetical protein DCY07_05725, partial [Rhodospirillaceae bacterium]|nr:hypothetical protein [Rhodospirillaceae bacterium]
MTSCTASRQENPVIWALISDGKQAYIFTYRKDKTIAASRGAWKKSSYNNYQNENRTAPLNRPESKEADNRNLSVLKSYTDAGGLFSEHNIVKDRFTRRRDRANDFISTVAATIDQAFDDKAFDYLVPVIPRETFRALRDCLGNASLSRLMTSMPEGYVYDKKGARCIGQRGAHLFSVL